MHVSSNRPVSEDEEKLMMYSPGGPFIMVAPVVTSWAVAGQRMVFLHMHLQTRVTLKAFPVATPRGGSLSSHEGEQWTLACLYLENRKNVVSTRLSQKSHLVMIYFVNRQKILIIIRAKISIKDANVQQTRTSLTYSTV